MRQIASSRQAITGYCSTRPITEANMNDSKLPLQFPKTLSSLHSLFVCKVPLFAAALNLSKALSLVGCQFGGTSIATFLLANWPKPITKKRAKPAAMPHVFYSGHCVILHPLAQTHNCPTICGPFLA